MPSKLSTRVSRLEKIVEKHEERLEKLENSVDTINKQLQDMRTRMTKQDHNITEINTNVKALWNFIKYFVAPALTGLIGLAIANLFT